MILIHGTGRHEKLVWRPLKITPKTEIAKGELKDTAGRDQMILKKALMKAAVNSSERNGGSLAPRY